MNHRVVIALVVTATAGLAASFIRIDKAQSSVDKLATLDTDVSAAVAPPSAVRAPVTVRARPKRHAAAAPTPALTNGVFSTVQERTDMQAQREAAVARADEGLHNLELQDPERFIEVFSMMEANSAEPKEAFDAARGVTRDYLNARTRLLEGMWRTFIDSAGENTSEATMDQVEALGKQYRADLQRFQSLGPALDKLPEMVEMTSHPAPFFAYAEQL